MPSPLNVSPFNPNRTHSVVWWNASDVHVNDVTLRKALTAVDPALGKLVRSPVTAHSALRRAMARRQGALADGWRWAEIGIEHKTRLVIALTSSTADITTKSWEAGARGLVVVDSLNGSFSTTLGRDNEDEVRAVEALEARYRIERGELTQGDVRDLVLKVILGKGYGQGVRIKEGGSLYLLPAPNDEVVGRITEAFGLSGLHLRTMPVFPESLTQLRADVHAGLLAEIADVRAEVERRKAAIDSGGKTTKAETLVARRAELDDLRIKAQLFRSVLAEDLAHVEQVLNDARRLVDDTDTAILSRLTARSPTLPIDILDI